jgi:cobaltochelatase CobN
LCTPAQIDDPAHFDTQYRQRALDIIDQVLAGTHAAEDFIAPEDLERMRQWDLMHKTMSDDELFAAMLSMSDAAGGEASGVPPEDLPRTRELAIRLAAEDATRDMLLSFREEDKFERAKIVLDPHKLEKARATARLIPPMRAALDLYAREDMSEMICLMQNPVNHEEAVRIVVNPGVQADIEAQRDQVRQALAEKALDSTRRESLFLSADPVQRDARLAEWSHAELDTFKEHLNFYLEQAHLADVVEAQPGNDAKAVAALMRHPSQIKEAVKAADACIARLDADEKRIVDAIRNCHEALTSVSGYREALLASTRAELDGVIRALAGGYISPSSGGDALANPNAVPTGRNLAAIDAEKCPTEAAWKTGVQLAEETIARKISETGEYPRKMAISLWGGEFIRTEGAEIAMILHMLGCEPVRNSRGAVHDIRVIPAEELGRPRIDVVVQTSGQFRDIASSRIFLINRAVKAASEAPDPPDATNNVREGTLAAERVMKERGVSPQEARELSTARVFGGVNGNYGAGIMGLVEAGDKWESDDEIAAQYLNNMGAVYTEERWGQFTAGAFEAALQNTDTLVHSRSSNTWGPLSLDHVYEFMGGMSAAIRNVTGEDADAFFADLRNGSAPQMQGAKEAIWAETRSTLMNPKYITDLQKGGASSADVFAETFRNTYGWNAMRPEIIDNEVWDNLYEVYIRDKYHLDMEAYFREKNPYALQEMSAVMLETSRKGLWKATPEQIQTLAALHAELVKDHKAGCSGFVCDNAKLREMIGNLLPEELRQAYDAAIDTVRVGAAAEAVQGMALEKELDPIAKASELMRENKSVVAGLALVVATVIIIVIQGARRKRA